MRKILPMISIALSIVAVIVSICYASSVKSANTDLQEKVRDYQAQGREIFPCPFCGSEDVELDDSLEIGSKIHCNDCGAYGPWHIPGDVGHGCSNTEAVNIWNEAERH